MPKRKIVPKKRNFPLIRSLVGAVIVVVVLSAGGLAFAANQESHDSFCASCHTQPESTYVQRSTAAQPADLASFHTGKETKCIDCHSGAGMTGRVQAEMLGARNAALWYSHTAVQPAKLTVPISDENCLKCHQEVTNSNGQNNHFHFFLSRWQAKDPNAATCNSCHSGHSTDGAAQDGFMTGATVQPVCDACHQALGGGE